MFLIRSRGADLRRLPETDIAHHLVATARIRIMQVFENTHVRAITRHDVVRRTAGELVKPKLGLAPVSAIL